MRKLAHTGRERSRDKKSKKGAATTAAVASADQPLLAALRALRQSLAAEAHVPPYVIFHDKTLVELAAKRPANEDALAGIIGLGTRKIARYGTVVIDDHRPVQGAPAACRTSCR